MPKARALLDQLGSGRQDSCDSVSAQPSKHLLIKKEKKKKKKPSKHLAPFVKPTCSGLAGG
jgi:hypothetical protein